MVFGDIYMAMLGECEGSIESGKRPVIIVSNNKANKHSPVITIIPLTGKLKKPYQPTHVYMTDCGLPIPSIALAEQITSINKTRLTEKMGTIKQTKYEKEIKQAMKVQLSMN